MRCQDMKQKNKYSKKQFKKATLQKRNMLDCKAWVDVQEVRLGKGLCVTNLMILEAEKRETSLLNTECHACHLHGYT